MATTHAGVDGGPDGRAHESVVEQLDEHVRSLVRREGVDPQLDVPVVRRIAENVVRDHDQRSLTGVVAPVADVESLVGELVARVAGFGPLQPYLDDPTVEEVWINDPSRVFVARHGRHELTNLVLTKAQVDELVERMLKSSGRRLDLSRPFVDAMLPEGHRLHVVLEGISRGFSAVNIRKFVLRASALSDLVALGSLSPRAASFLDASVRAGLNILVAGGTQAGKTTFLNCLASSIPGGERVVSAEEVFELRFRHPDWVALQTRQSGLEGTGAVRLRDLVKESLRMRPEPDDRRRGAGGGVPGPAARPQRRDCPACAPSTPTARGRRWSRCARCRCWPGRTSRRVSSCRRSRRRSTSWCTSASTSTACDGSTRSSPCRAASRTTSSRPSRSSSATATDLRRTGGMPPRVERFQRLGIDVHGILTGARRGDG